MRPYFLTLLAAVVSCGTPTPLIHPGATPPPLGQKVVTVQPTATNSLLSESTGGPIAVVPASQGSFATTFTANIAGQGSNPDNVGSFQINGNVGTITVNYATMPVLAYEEQLFTDTLIQALGVTANAWYVFWFYCNNGSLATLYYESTAGEAMTDENVAGSCAISSATSTNEVDYPESTLPAPALVGGYKIQGSNIFYDGTHPGTITIAGSTSALYPFNAVICTDCGNGGWYELHSLLVDATQTTFAILYLQTEGSVQLDYGITLPTFTDPSGVNGTLNFNGSWTVP